MSTIRATYVQHGSSAVPNITLNASGQVIVASGIVSSGTFAAPSGSVSAPGIYFNGDSNTGLYSPAADTIAFTEGGVEALRIDSSGRVGIGTNAPSTLFDVQGVSGNAKIQAKETSTNKKIQLEANSAYHAIYADGAVPVYHYSNGSVALTIDSSQRVGIGTTTVSDKLHVDNGGNDVAIRLSRGAQYGTFGADSTGIGVKSAGTDPLYFSVNGTERVRLDSSGRLLVGTSSDLSSGETNRLIQAAASTGAFVLLSRTDATITNNEVLAGVEFRGNGNPSASIYAWADADHGTNDYPGRLVFSTTSDSASSPTERVRINAAGAFKQSVNGSYRSATGSYSEFRQTDGSTSVLYVDMQSNSADNVMLMVNCLRSAASAYSFIQTRSGDMADVEHNLRGDGNGLCDGSWTGGGADYAEYFEWADGNPDAEDRRGISVVLDGGKIREAAEGEDPIGVISGNPSVVGDSAWNKWSGKYMRDDFGSYLLDENGHRQLAPAFDPDQEYIPREERPEWDCVGLMGKLRIRKGQATGSRWIKMRDISDSVEEWLVR